MKTKKLFIVLFAIMMAITATAQQANGKGKGQRLTPEERAKKQTEMMKTELQLTDDQVAKVEAINIKNAVEKDKITKEYKEKKKAINTQRKDELKTVLTAEQQTKLKEIGKKRSAERKQKRQQMKNCMKDMGENSEN